MSSTWEPQNWNRLPPCRSGPYVFYRIVLLYRLTVCGTTGSRYAGGGERGLHAGVRGGQACGRTLRLPRLHRRRRADVQLQQGEMNSGPRRVSSGPRRVNSGPRRVNSGPRR
eukprot:1190319-Prorocentrum_minimum.AAC.1